MELVVTGWGRDHGEKVIARRDLTESRSYAVGGYGRPEVYVESAEGKEDWSFGKRAVDKGNVELRFFAKITLNGEYLVRQTLTRKEVVKLFLSLYDTCSFDEILDVIADVKGRRPPRDFAPILLKRVEDVGLSHEVVAWLAKCNIWYVGDLVQRERSELTKLAGFEPKFLYEIGNKLVPLGLQFGLTIDRWPSMPEFLKQRVDEFEMSVRTANCLKNEGIVYLIDLVKKTEAEMLRTPNFGRKSLDEVKETILEPLGLHFGMAFP